MDVAEATSFSLLGKRWSALIIQELAMGPRRFREILGGLGRINDKVLSQRLKELEEAGIITRRVFAEVPTRVEYALSEKGRGLVSIVREMERWDEAWTQSGPSRSTRRTAVPAVATPLGAGSSNLVGPSLMASPALVASLPAPSQPPLSSQKGAKSFWKRLGL